jgi:hypothetical protein
MIKNALLTDIHNIINKTAIRTEEKKKFGEVFTPIKLIDGMLDTLPLHVWSNPYLKWIDPTAGIGNFTMIVLYRLMDGLQLWEPDYDKRFIHVKNMIHMVELNPENVTRISQLFGECNIICADFLTTQFQHSFDIIVGNPPFSNKLYEKITHKCLDMLTPDGHLLFIAPNNLFSGNTKLYKKLLNCHVKHINLSIPFFPKIQQNICSFLLQSNKLSNQIGKTAINGVELMLKDRPLNPINDWTQLTDNLLDKYISKVKNNSIYNRGKNIADYYGSKYELIYTPHKNIFTDDASMAVGHGIPKIVIFCISPTFEFKTDFDGLYGVGPNTFYIPIHSNGSHVEKLLKSDEYLLIANAVKTTRQFLKIGLIQYLIY